MLKGHCFEVRSLGALPSSISLLLCDIRQGPLPWILLTSPIKTLSLPQHGVIFWIKGDHQYKGALKTQRPLEFDYSKNSRLLTSDQSIHLVKVNISFFCVCRESVCTFYSVEMTSVTLPLKLAGDGYSAGGKEQASDFIREAQPQEHQRQQLLDGHQSWGHNR